MSGPFVASAALVAERDPVAVEACRRLVANDNTSDLSLMIDIGSTAAQSLDNSVRTIGNLLRNVAQLAATNKVGGATAQQQDKDGATLATVAAELLNACYRSGLWLI